MADEIYRIVKDENYVVMDRRFLHNPHLSWKAKGILAYVLTLPNDWKFHIEELASHSTDGEKGLRAGWNELKELGYINRIPIREGQRIVSWETQIFEHPSLNPLHAENGKVQDSLHADSVHVPFVDVASVHVQNRRLLSIDKELSIDSTKSTTTTGEFYSEVGIVETYKQVFGGLGMMPSLWSKYIRSLKKRGLEDEVISEALLHAGESATSGKPNLNFFTTIMERWIEDGIKSREQAKAHRDKSNPVVQKRAYNKPVGKKEIPIVQSRTDKPPTSQEEIDRIMKQAYELAEKMSD